MPELKGRKVKKKSKQLIIFSSKSSEWETPTQLFDELNKEFDFTVDLCSSGNNQKCNFYFRNLFIEESNVIDIRTFNIHNYILSSANNKGHVACFMNPPYGRTIPKFISKALELSKQYLVVALVPARTDTRWWGMFWDHTKHKPIPGVQVRFLKGRVKFELGGVPAPNQATFPSAVVIMDRRNV